MSARALNGGVPNMTTPLSVHRSSFRHTELDQAMLKQRLEGSDRLSGQQQTPVAIVQHKDERAMFDEVFLPHMAEAYRLAQWLTGNAYDAEDVVQDAALRAFRGIKSFGAVNARAWSLTIVRNAAYSWLMKNRPKAVVFTDDLSVAEQHELEHEGPYGTRIETPEEIALFKADAEDVVQDAALRAFRGIKGFGAVNARAWSLTIVRNAAYSWLMKNKPKAVVFTDDLSVAEQQELEHEGPYGTRIETPEEIALFKADAQDVQHALAQLPAHFREVIVLREINQLNYRDIAEVTNVPIGTVMSRLSRGRQLLIALLGDRK